MLCDMSETYLIVFDAAFVVLVPEAPIIPMTGKSYTISFWVKLLRRSNLNRISMELLVVVNKPFVQDTAKRDLGAEKFFSLGLHLLLHPPDSEHASHISLISPHLTMVRRTLRRQFNRDQLVNLPRDPNKKSTMARQFKQVNYGLEVAPAQIIHPKKPSNSPGLETIHEEGAEGFDEDA
ncbi:hypothetical protein SAY87_027532 [Trapa incisa]|uniref:Uncharacterized protein n=1 Tax=Trapa incisa TaxID=236973 RepID=A0AAN7JML4_9MYRT|nr:hypothetical protein SAY87_027532 [Trapa incisa]